MISFAPVKGRPRRVFSPVNVTGFEPSCAISGIIILKNGESHQEIADKYKQRYYHGYVREVYPIDAMNLNTGIMIDRIEKEYIQE